MNHKISIGVDIGGSHITCMAFDMKKNEVIRESMARQSVDSQASAEIILQAWANALKECLSKVNVHNLIGIGFAMPGPFDYSQGIALFKGVQKFDGLYGVNVKEELTKMLDLPKSVNMRFENDATCFAIGESWLGAAAGYHKSMALTLGTGFGSAFLIDGIPVDKGEGVADFGCIYHIPYRDGIADDYFSSRWFVNEYKSKTGKIVEGVKDLTLIGMKDAAAHEIFNDFGKRLGEFLLTWIKSFKTECIVIGGNIALSLPLFHDALTDVLEKTNCEIKMAVLFEEAAIAGSARLMDNDFFTKINLSSNK